MRIWNVSNAAKIILLGFFSTVVTIQSQAQRISADWESAQKVYQKQNVTMFLTRVADSLQVKVFIEDPVIIDQIRLCGFSLFVNNKGKKKDKTGVQYPVGFDESALPEDPERLQMSLSNLPPFEISDQRQQYGVYREGELSQGAFPSPSGLRIEWYSSFDGVEILYQIPPDISGYEPGEIVRLGWRCGILGRPDLTGNDGVGVYGTNPSNPNVVADAAVRARLNMFERYREFTIERNGWSGKIDLE